MLREDASGLQAAQPGNPRTSANPGDHLIAALAANASNHGSGIAMRERDRGIWQETTWQDYLRHTLEAAAGLEALGMAAHDKVLVVGDNRPALYFGMLGAITLRAIPSPAYPDFTPEQLLGQLQREGVRFAIAEDQEQVDKLVALRGQYQGLQWIIYDDPRGLAGHEPEGTMAFTELARRGRERLQAEPTLADALQRRPQADDVAILLHSSGTTGAPKGIPLKHRHVLFAVRSAAQAGYFRTGETHMAYMPIAWVGDFIFTIAAALALQFSVNIPEKQETVQRDLREIAPTVYFTSPRAWSTMLTRVQVGIAESTPGKRWLYQRFMPLAVDIERARLKGQEPGLGQRLLRALGELLVYGPIKDQLGLSRAQHAYTAGEAIGEEIFLFFRALGLPLRQFYGQTENSALCAAQEMGSVKLHTVGKPFPGIDLKISDSGEILVRGGNVFDGYFQDDAASAESLRDGWLHTGDAGYLEDDGQLVVLGRVSEVIYTRGGQRFIPTFIENQLKFSPYIKDVCVLGDGRDYLAALLAIDWEAVGHWAQERGVTYTSFSELSQQSGVYDLMADLFASVNARLPEGTRIRRFVNLHKEFDPDDGEVTRTRKLRRGVIAEHYADIIEAIYAGKNDIESIAHITYETGETGVLKRHLAIRDVPASAGAAA
ncbi:MAG: long-chain fatty acid--CoA ligase [Burkholderiales bacterium 66-5]|uniref:AMP-dependent synthetase/ligase n=1 Tax=Comamonas badia TaxID=265291 RepID=UPI0003F5A8A2|nr:AMP-binding protein [Comamonas badia]OJU90074.1 MAG: long-chain fatty acid--CoA ligase [Burkholderiales bacterium 66-5]